MSSLSPTPVTRTIVHLETLRRNSDGSFPTVTGVLAAPAPISDQLAPSATSTAPTSLSASMGPASTQMPAPTGSTRDAPPWKGSSDNGIPNAPAAFSGPDQTEDTGQYNRSGLIVGLTILAFICLAIGGWSCRCYLKKRRARLPYLLAMDAEVGPYHRQTGSTNNSSFSLEKGGESNYDSFSQTWYQYPAGPPAFNIGIATTTDSIPRATSKEAINYLKRNSRLSPVSELPAESESTNASDLMGNAVSLPEPETAKVRISKSFVPLQNPVNLTVDVVATKDVSRVSYRSPTETIYKCYNDRDSVAPSVFSTTEYSQEMNEPVPPMPKSHLVGPTKL